MTHCCRETAELLSDECTASGAHHLQMGEQCPGAGPLMPACAALFLQGRLKEGPDIEEYVVKGQHMALQATF